MISRSLSSVARSPPLASGWWRFTKSFDLDAVGAVLQAEFMQRLALGIANGTGLRLDPLGLRPPIRAAAAQLAKHIERVARTLWAEIGPPRAIAGPHLPGWTMAGDGVLLIFRNGILAHAGEVIVGVVVFAHVLETEPPILVLAQPSLGGAVRRLIAAALPVTRRAIRAQTAVLRGLDPDTIVQG
jgi:hypothetical protein